MHALLLLLLTLVVEAALACGWAARREVLPAGVAANLITHPLAVLALEGGLDFWPIEAAVFVAEVAAYRLLAGVSWWQALWLSLACNGATVALSFALLR